LPPRSPTGTLNAKPTGRSFRHRPRIRIPFQAPRPDPRRHPRRALPGPRRAARRPAEDDITLSLQCDISRVSVLLEHVERWKGPISISILTTVDDIEKLTSVLSTASPDFIRNVDIHVATKKSKWSHYPINTMRNLALANIESKWVFVLDIDEDTIFSMSEYKAEIHNAITQNPDSNPSKTVFAVTSWQYATNSKGSYPSSKSSLLDLWNSGVVTVKAPHFPPAYTPSIGLNAWANLKSSTTFSFTDLYEPYYIRRVTRAPEFDTKFIGWGYNKSIQTFTMAVNGFRYVVLPNVFTFVTDTPEQSFNHKPPADPNLPNLAWNQLGKLRGCDECDPNNCIKKCPWLLPFKKGGVTKIEMEPPKEDKANPRLNLHLKKRSNK